MNYKTWRSINPLLVTLIILWGPFAGIGFCQSDDWKVQRPLVTEKNLLDAHFISIENAWAVGFDGTIIHTGDGGLTWQKQISSVTSNLNSIYFKDTLNGWIVGDSGIIENTTNGGNSWQIQNSTTLKNLQSVHFISAGTGFAVGASGIMLKTTNRGLNWVIQSGVTSNQIHSIYFSDSLNGWAVGAAGTILATENGGNTWLPQSSGTLNYLYSIHFSDSLNGLAVGINNTILKTMNGGQTWQIITASGNATSLLHSAFVVNSQICFVVGEYGKILKTTNGGSSWTTYHEQIVNFYSDYSFNFIHFLDSQTGWIFGEYGTLLKTTDLGTSWKSANPNREFKSVYFNDPMNGWAVGAFGTRAYTSNGGQTWLFQDPGSNDLNLNSVKFVNPLTGWIVGDGGTIIKTIDGGQTWQNQNSGVNSGLSSVFFFTEQIGWVSTTGGQILKTTNGGQSWISFETGTSTVFLSVCFTDELTGWVVGGAGTILKTTNGGQTWQIQSSGASSFSYLTSVQFVDNQTGWVVGQLSQILKTTNGGQTWLSQNPGSGAELASISFIDSQLGYAVGGNGSIYSTTNGGLNWIIENSGVTNYLSGVHFTDPLHGWAVGTGGIIITPQTNSYFEPQVATSLINGRLFKKAPNSCEPTTIPVRGRFVKAIPGPYFGISDSEGNYSIQLPLGKVPVTYSLTTVGRKSPVCFTTPACPSGNYQNITLDTIPDTISRNFGFEITQCHHLNVQIASNRRRRCFQNVTTISFSNMGSSPAPDAYIIVEFPRWVRPVSSTKSYAALNDSVWRFNLDTVSAGGWGSFSITDSVICGHPEIQNLNQCTKATIYPAPDCPSPSGWNGAEISVSGQCLGGNVNLGIYNKGNSDMTDSVDYWVYLDSIQVKKAKVKLAAGDSIKLVVDANGLSVYLTANQVASHPAEIFVSTTVDNCSDSTIFQPRPFVNRFPKQQTPGSKSHCLTITGSFDPNDKQVFPIGFTSNHIVKSNTELEYLIRFQNTGTDTAFNVYVIDSLDENLNVESLEIGAVSHPYQITLRTTRHGRNFLQFHFNQINLPDSNSNELKSQGFIQYRISPKSALSPGSQVKNKASIFFDFNPPVETNTTLSTFENLIFTDSSLNNNVQVITASKRQIQSKQSVQVFPNPFSNTITVSTQSEGSISVSVCDVVGKQLLSKQFSGSSDLSLGHLPAGIYFIRFPDQNQTYKLMKER